MIGGIDLSNMIQLEPELIQEYYDHYDMSNYAQPMITLINIAKSMPDSKITIAIKNVCQSFDILPPDDKDIAIKNMMSMGVTAKNALKAVNELTPVSKKKLPVLIEAIRNKIPQEQFKVFEPFLTQIEMVNDNSKQIL